MIIWQNRWLIGGVLAVLVVASALTLRADAQGGGAADPPAPAQAQPAPPPVPVVSDDGGVWLEDQAPEWHPAEEIVGRFEGYCKDGQPVITAEPARQQTPTGIIKATCHGDRLVNEIVYTYPEPQVMNDPLDPKRIPHAPPDWSHDVRIRLNNYLLVNPRFEPDVFPYITITGRTLIPVRWLAEAAGARIRWNATTQEIAIYWHDQVIRMHIGDPQATVNGTAITLEQPPQIIAGRTMVPARFAVEGMGGTVKWVQEKSTVEVTLEGATCPPAYCLERREEVQNAYNATFEQAK